MKKGKTIEKEKDEREGKSFLMMILKNMNLHIIIVLYENTSNLNHNECQQTRKIP